MVRAASRWLVIGARCVGVLFVLPVGGADVPIVISLLNAFTGLSVAASGYVLDNPLLLVAGTLVGAAGTLLTRLMAAAMGRSLGEHPVRRVQGRLDGRVDGEVSDRPVRSASAEDVAILLGYARKVVIVPGYGLAVAQAQHTLRELVDVLTERGVQVDLRHPPGRRPDARTHERAAGRGQACPTTSSRRSTRSTPSSARPTWRWWSAPTTWSTPPPRPRPGAPIYGMPILRRRQAQAVVFLKRSMRPGFAGIENELLYEPQHHAAVRRRQGLAHQGAGRGQGAVITVPAGR